MRNLFFSLIAQKGKCWFEECKLTNRLRLFFGNIYPHIHMSALLYGSVKSDSVKTSHLSVRIVKSALKQKKTVYCPVQVISENRFSIFKVLLKSLVGQQTLIASSFDWR